MKYNNNISHIAAFFVAAALVFSTACQCEPEPGPGPVVPEEKASMSVSVTDGIILSSGGEFFPDPDVKVRVTGGDDKVFSLAYVFGTPPDTLSGKTMRFFGKREYSFSKVLNLLPLTRDHRYGTVPVSIGLLDGEDGTVLGTWSGLLSVRGETVTFYPAAFTAAGKEIEGDAPVNLNLGEVLFVSRSWEPWSTPVEVLSVERLSGSGKLAADLSALGNTGQAGYAGVIGTQSEGIGRLSFPLTATEEGEAVYRFVFANGTQRDTVQRAFSIAWAPFTLSLSVPESWHGGQFGPVDVNAGSPQDGVHSYSLAFRLDDASQAVYSCDGVTLPLSGLMFPLGEAGESLEAGEHVMTVTATRDDGESTSARASFSVPAFKLGVKAVSEMVSFGHPLQLEVSGFSSGRAVTLTVTPDEGALLGDEPSPKTFILEPLSSQPVTVTVWNECPLSGNSVGVLHTLAVKAVLDTGENREAYVSVTVKGGPVDNASLLYGSTPLSVSVPNRFESGRLVRLRGTAASNIPGVTPYVRAGSGSLESSDASVVAVKGGSWASGWNVSFTGIGEAVLTMSVADVREHVYDFPIAVFGTAAVPVSLSDDSGVQLRFGVPQGFGCESRAWNYSGAGTVKVSHEGEEIVNTGFLVSGSSVSLSEIIPDMAAYCSGVHYEVSVTVSVTVSPKTPFDALRFIEFKPEVDNPFDGRRVTLDVSVGK